MHLQKEILEKDITNWQDWLPQCRGNGKWEDGGKKWERDFTEYYTFWWLIMLMDYWKIKTNFENWKENLTTESGLLKLQLFNDFKHPNVQIQ